MTDWASEYYRNPSFARQLAQVMAYALLDKESHTENPMERATTYVNEALRDVLEPIVGQIEEYPISEDEIKRMSAEIRSLYQ